MKKYLITILSALILTVGVARADTIYQLQQWGIHNGILSPISSSTLVQIPTLANAPCISGNASGTLASTTCGSGGGSTTNVFGVAPISVSQVGTNATVTFVNPGYLTSSTGLSYFYPSSSNPSNFLSSVIADSPLSGSGTSGSHLIFTNPGYLTSSTGLTYFFPATTTVFLSTSTFNATGTPSYFPFWSSGGTSLTATSGVYEVASGTGECPYTFCIGIGTTTPDTSLDLYATSATANDPLHVEQVNSSHGIDMINLNPTPMGIHMTANNAATGYGLSNGFDVGIDNFGDGLLRTYNNFPINIITSGTQMFSFNTNGSVTYPHVTSSLVWADGSGNLISTTTPAWITTSTVQVTSPLGGNGSAATPITFNGITTSSLPTANTLAYWSAANTLATMNTGTGLSITGTTLNASSTYASSSVTLMQYDANIYRPYNYTRWETSVPITISKVDCGEYAAATNTVDLYIAPSPQSFTDTADIVASLQCNQNGTSTTTFASSTLPSGYSIVASTTAITGTPSMTNINVWYVKS